VGWLIAGAGKLHQVMSLPSSQLALHVLTVKKMSWCQAKFHLLGRCVLNSCRSRRYGMPTYISAISHTTPVGYSSRKAEYLSKAGTTGSHAQQMEGLPQTCPIRNATSGTPPRLQPADVQPCGCS
jgi:hypothetical protein